MDKHTVDVIHLIYLVTKETITAIMIVLIIIFILQVIFKKIKISGKIEFNIEKNTTE